MRPASVAGPAGTVAAILATTMPAFADPARHPLQASEITRALRGKLCTSGAGATFLFERDGHYAYSGLWTDQGHYSVQDGAVTILLDSGLERAFAISRRGGVLYMEETAIACG